MIFDAKNPYNYFDTIRCISLRDAHERHAFTNDLAKQLQIPLKMYFVDRHSLGGLVGCFTSHINLIKEVYADKNIRNALIFEDDIVLSPSYNPQQLFRVVSFMYGNKDWELIQLGYMPFKGFYDLFGVIRFLLAPEVSPSIVKYHGVFTHAYIVSRRGMRRIIDAASKIDIPKIHLDIWYCKIIKNGYCTVPILFDQRWCAETTNTQNSLIEKTLRANSCKAEKYKLIYWMSSIYLYREVLAISIIIIILFLIVAMVFKNVYFKKRR